MRATRSPLVFNVADMEPGERRVESVGWAPTYAVELSRTAGVAHAEMILESIFGGVRLFGEIDVVYSDTCYRCTTEFDRPARLVFDAVFSRDEDAEYRLDDDELDAEPLLRDEITLAMPLRPLCRPDCPGLCPDCGFDLNSCVCSLQDEAANRPFASLRELLDP
ncbi:MAG: DUF177 domain-containing protein [Acidimicrobiia bacterium]